MKNNFFDFALPALETDAGRLRQRILQPIGGGEFLGLTLAIGMTLAFVWQQAHNAYPFRYDLGNYLNAAHGDFSHYYYAYWFLPAFWVFAKLPFAVSYLIWNLLNIAGVVFALRVFGGKAVWALTGYQMIFTIFQGNITGILAGMLALMWLCLVNKKWIWGGLFFLLASTKYQLGIPFGLLLIAFAPGTWSEKVRALIFPIIITLASLAIWGFWPLDVFESLRQYPPDAQGNISLWNWIGALALLVWIPPFTSKIPGPHRVTMLLCAFFLGSPYLQQSDLIVLFSFMPNPLAILGNVGYVLAATRFDLLQYMAFLPLGIYLWAWIASGRASPASDAE